MIRESVVSIRNADDLLVQCPACKAIEGEECREGFPRQQRWANFQHCVRTRATFDMVRQVRRWILYGKLDYPGHE